MAVIEIDRMTLAEKLLAMETLWADLCRHEVNLPMFQWQKDILDEREQLIRNDQARFSDWETAKRRINSQTS